MADILLGNVKGPQGNTGATGSQGPRGDAATITVGTVSTTAYGNTAQVINSGTEQDAVLDFVIPQGKPGEQTTRMGALTLDTITAQSADFPIPAVGETGSTVFGKIIKFFNSTISALNSKLNISDVVNNLTSTSTTKPLSAAQGKALNDALGKWIRSPSTNSVEAVAGTDISQSAPGLGFRMPSANGHTYNVAFNSELIAFGIDGTNTQFVRHNWARLATALPYQVSSTYKMVYVDLIFSQGQHCGAALPVDGIGHRVDTGFYYTSGSNGSAAITITAAGTISANGYYAGSSVSFSSVAVYGI